MGFLKKIGRSLKTLPNSLLATLGFFALLPFWSLSFISLSDVTSLKGGAAIALISGLTYWVLPILICVATLARSFSLLVFFLADCSGLVALAFLSRGSGGLVVAKLAFLAVAMLVGLVIAQKDLLYPFMARGARFWRRTPRLFANHQLLLRRGTAEPVRSMLEDCSLSGMAVALGDEAVAGVSKGEQAEVEIQSRGRTIVVPVQVVWVRIVDDMTRVGLEALRTEAMQDVFQAVTEQSQRSGSLSRSFERLWAVSAVRRTALVLFGVSLAASFGMPACGVMSSRPDMSNKRSGHGTESASATAESTAAVAPAPLPGVDWRQAAVVGQSGTAVSFALDANDDDNVLIDASTVLAGAAISLPKGSIKHQGTLTVRPGINLNTADFWAWLTDKPMPPAKTPYASLEFYPDRTDKAVAPLTVRLPLNPLAGQSVDPNALVILYRVLRGGVVTYGVIGPDRLRLVDGGPSLGLAAAGAAATVEFDLTTSFSGSIQAVEMSSPVEAASVEKSVGDAASVAEPRHVLLVCALPADRQDPCEELATTLQRGGQVAQTTAADDIPSLTAAGDAAHADDVLIIGNGSLEDGHCFAEPAGSCVAFANLAATLRSATSARLWLLNCPAPASLPSGFAAAECLAAGDGAASRLMQLLNDPLVGLYSDSDGHLSASGIGHYLDQHGTDSNFIADTAVVAGGAQPSVTKSSTGGATATEASTHGAGSSAQETNAANAGGSGSSTSASTGGMGDGAAATASTSSSSSTSSAGTGNPGGTSDASASSTGSSDGAAYTGATTNSAGSSGTSTTNGATSGSLTTDSAGPIEGEPEEPQDFPEPDDQLADVTLPASVCTAPKAPTVMCPGTGREIPRKLILSGLSIKNSAGVVVDHIEMENRTSYNGVGGTWVTWDAVGLYFAYSMGCPDTLLGGTLGEPRWQISLGYPAQMVTTTWMTYGGTFPLQFNTECTPYSPCKSASLRLNAP